MMNAVIFIGFLLIIYLIVDLIVNFHWIGYLILIIGVIAVLFFVIAVLFEVYRKNSLSKKASVYSTNNERHHYGPERSSSVRSGGVDYKYDSDHSSDNYDNSDSEGRSDSDGSSDTDKSSDNINW